jgi:hypothetical protein
MAREIHRLNIGLDRQYGEMLRRLAGLADAWAGRVLRLDRL